MRFVVIGGELHNELRNLVLPGFIFLSFKWEKKIGSLVAPQGWEC